MAGRTVRRRGLVAAVAALAMAATACGTTVPNASQKLAQGNQLSTGGLGQQASDVPSGGSTGAATDGSGAGSGPAGSGGAAGATGTGAGTGSGSVATGGAPGAPASRTNGTTAP